MKKLLFYIPLFCLCSCSQSNEASSDQSVSSLSRSAVFEYVYPHVDQILNSSVVRLAMEEAWGRMKMQVASNAGRREYGFYIYYNHDTGQFYVGPTIQGAIEIGCAGSSASIHLGVVSNNIDVCGFFHCHTSIAGCPDRVYRRTGPSNSDYNFAESYDLPGILYDYSESTITTPFHSVGDSYQAYVFGPEQRSTMYIDNN